MLPDSLFTKGMLQGFDEVECLLQIDEVTVAQKAACKAAELAMLGLAEEANSLMSLLGAHETVVFDHDLRLEFFWAESDKPRPAGLLTPLDKFGYNEEERLQKLRENALRFRNRIPKWSLTEESFHQISKIVEKETQERSARVTDATYGLVAEKLSDAYSALLSIALHLGWQEKIAELMAKVVHRIHADFQCQRLGIIRATWKPYLLSGRLRDAIGADLQALRGYARFVHDTTERRLKNGPLHPHSLYKDWTIRQIVEEIDRNTVTGIEIQSKDNVLLLDGSAFFHGKKPSTVRREPVTPLLIRDAESRMGRALPADMKEFYGITDGFDIVKCESNPVDFEIKLPALVEVYLEDEEWMEEYVFELVSGLTDVPWPGILGGGIAFYDDNGQGTLYTWIISAEAIAKAKESLWEYYETASDERKQEIERKIAHQFGSMEVLDGIKEYCVYEQPWGGVGDGRVYHTFVHYLESVAVKTRFSKERSPLKSDFILSKVRPAESNS